MKKVILSLCMVICVAACASPVWAQSGLDQRVSELSQQIAGKMSAKQKTNVAVVEFTDLQGNVTDFGRFLAEELVTRLGDLEKFKVIERQLLNKIIAEQKLSLSGVVDPASAKQLGKILGVDAIVAGTVTNLAQNVRVNARLISTETGEVFAVAAADIFKDESVTGLLSGGSSAPQAVKPSPQQPDPKKTARRVAVRDFIVELESCRMSAGGIVCSLSITNDSPSDRVVRINVESFQGVVSRMFDESGGEYVATSSQLGSHSSRGYSTYTNSLVSQVPMKHRVAFDNVNPDAKTVTLLRITFEWQDSNRIVLNADFRNVPITK
ncbi:MAG TPA: FlgO family outer membrane protein [Pyrinomonadaceae bacterium]|nr:FlgO family outer membrane protein [Pyrinomonadaceae bacterium]